MTGMIKMARTADLMCHMCAAYDAARMKMNWRAPKGMLSSVEMDASNPNPLMSVGPNALVTLAPMFSNILIASQRMVFGS